jgi:hypothetical protein
MATHKTPTTRRTTKAARPGCQCPLCAGTTATANGVYHCRASTWIEYVMVNQGEYLGTRATELSAQTELNAYRRDQMVAPVEAAAAEADIEAEIAAFVAEVEAAQPDEDALVSEWKCAVILYGNDSLEAEAAMLDLDIFRHQTSPCSDTCQPCADETAVLISAVNYENWIERINSVPGVCYCGSPLAGDGCTRDDCLNYPPTIRPALLPLAYKPAIYPTADGWTFEGAGRCYPSNIDADLARAELLAAA